MKRTAMLPLVLACLAAATLLRPAGSAQGPPHVVIISLDGFPAWALDDPHLPVPTLRRLGASGAVAAGMRPVNPTVTWPNHTSMITGVTPAKHGVLFNGLLVRERGVPPRVEPWRDKADMVRVPTLYDAAHARGLTTAQVDWVAIYNAPTVTWEFRERPDPANPVSRELVEAGLVSAADIADFGSRNIVFRDHVWTMAAAHIVRRHKPNLLLFHLLNLDSTQHRYGPRTPAAMSVMALLDSQVATLMRAIEESGTAARTTVFVVSDHGFKAVRRHIRPNAAFREAGLLRAEAGRTVQADVYAVPEGGTAIVYVTVPDDNGARLARAKEALAGIEGLEAIVEAPGFAQYGLPPPADGGQMGSLLLVAKDGYAFTGDAAEPIVGDSPPASLGTHGYPASDEDLHALFIASGRGIRPGVRLDTVATVDLAPTAARLLGVELANVDGRVIEEILAPGGR